MIALLDDVRDKLVRLFRAPEGSFAFAVSGTGTAGMETAVANLVGEGTRVLVVVGGYFGDRLAQMCERYGADGARGSTSSGDARAIRRRSGRRSTSSPADVVAMVHAETSTGVLNPVRELAAVARERDALTIVDAVTSFGGMPLDVGAWGIDACYSCTQKCLGAPSGPGAGRLRPARARAARQVPQLLLRSLAAAGLLAPPQVPPHDVVARSSTRSPRRSRSSTRKGWTRDGRGTSGITARSSTA